MVKTGVQVDPGKQFEKAIKKALKKVDNLKPAFDTMSDEYFQTNKSIFALKGTGLYADLSKKPLYAFWLRKNDNAVVKNNGSKFFKGGYKQLKTFKYGKPYPILKAEGTLEKSLTDKNDSNAIKIITKKTMILGTKAKSKKGAPYPIFLQKGWTTPWGNKVPARPFLLIGKEPHPAAKQETYQRRLRVWLNTIENYVLKVTKES